MFRLGRKEELDVAAKQLVDNKNVKVRLIGTSWSRVSLVSIRFKKHDDCIFHKLSRVSWMTPRFTGYPKFYRITIDIVSAIEWSIIKDTIVRKIRWFTYECTYLYFYFFFVI